MIDPVLVLKDVEKYFGERLIFTGVSLTLSAGEVLVIIGDSGVGKTTLLRAIAGLTSFGGRIEVAGEPVSRRDLHSGRSKRVLVLQHANLWDHLTALDNVALVRQLLHEDKKSTARRTATEYLKLLEVVSVAGQFPQSLSGGEQQRVSLARGFAAETPLLLLDEVTSQVDSQRKHIIAKAILTMAAAGRSIVIVSHDSETARLLEGRSVRLTTQGLQTA